MLNDVRIDAFHWIGVLHLHLHDRCMIAITISLMYRSDIVIACMGAC